MPKKSKISKPEVGFFDPGAVAAERQACLRWLRETHLDRAAWKSFEIGLLWMLARIDIPLGTSFVQSQLEAETSIDDLWGEVHGNVGGKARSHRKTWWGDWVAATKRVDAAIHAGNLAASDKSWVAVADALRWLQREGANLPPEWVSECSTTTTPLMTHINEVTISKPPKDAGPVAFEIWQVMQSIKHSVWNFPTPEWFAETPPGDAWMQLMGANQSDAYKRAASGGDTRAPIMLKLADVRRMLESARERLNALPHPLRAGTLGTVRAALADLPQAPQADRAWQDCGGDFRQWADAARPWFAQFWKRHEPLLKAAYMEIEDLLRDPEALRAYEPAPPPTPDLPRKREDALWALHRAKAFSVEAKASKAEIRKKNPELDPNTLRYNLRKLEDAGLVAKGESGRGWYLTAKGEAHIRHLKE